MSRFEIIDNFLTKEEWKKQFDLVFSTDFKWIYGKKNFDESPFKSIIFQHWFHGDENLTVRHYDSRFISPAEKPNTAQPYWDIMCQPILDKFDVKRIMNIRTNLYTHWHETNNEAGTHLDHQIDEDYLTLIYYINGSDGATWFEGQGNIEKIPNRMVIADGKIPHRCVYQTNVKAQIATNINITV
tara:strand:- start:227 stop:781 length:555 start_codon:yes stop_codon:yes gene_type:complete